MRRILAGIVASLSLSSGALMAQDWADLEVTIIYEGKDVPTMKKLDMAKDAECAKFTQYEEELVVNPKNKGIKNTALYIDFKKSKLTAKDIDPDQAKVPDIKPVLDNKDCAFVPHALVVRPSQTLIVKNSDNTGHNASISFINNPPVNPTVPAMGQTEVKVESAEDYLVNVVCGSHGWMKAKLMILDHPYGGFTDENGYLKMTKVPAKTLTFKLFHEHQNKLDEVTINGKKEAWPKGFGTLELKPGANKFEIKIDSSRFKAISK